jgi:hypothetical protein
MSLTIHRDMAQGSDEWLAARAAASLRQLENPQPIDAAATRETQQRVVRVRNEQLFDEIFVFDRGGRFATTGHAPHPPQLRGRIVPQAPPWSSKAGRAIWQKPRFCCAQQAQVPRRCGEDFALTPYHESTNR